MLNALLILSSLTLPQKAVEEAPAQKTKDVSTVIEVEKVPETLEHRSVLGTKGYEPTEKEKPHLETIDEKERITGNLFQGYDIHGRKGQIVSWFGIVREIESVKKGKEDPHHRLLIEHKYFDGLTDTHQQVVSFNGDGDFTAIIHDGRKKLPIEQLVLVRVYGKVIDEVAGVPVVDVGYVRVWPWKTYAFMTDYGEDHGNKKWREDLWLPDRLYSAVPNQRYYESLLGKRKTKPDEKK